MTNLENVQADSNWGAESARINKNFSALSTEVEKMRMSVSLNVPLFSSVSEATSKILSPYEGKLVLIGNSLPAPVYRWSGTGWVNTGVSGGSASIPLSDYYTKDEIDSRFQLIKSTTEVTI
jgi:hypothetical protein